MLGQDKCLQIFNRVISHRDQYTLNQVEASSHMLYGVSFDIDNNIEACKLLLDGEDVYRIISNAFVNKSYSQDWNYLVIYTEGWASPVDRAKDIEDDQIMPSQHPERKRVKLVCVVCKDDKENIESVMLLKDSQKPDYTLGGTGELAKALLSIYSRNKNVNTNTKHFYI